MRTPLKGHTSEETSYLVNDYPYGRKVRCRIRYWLESNNNGVRFVSQTENPKTLHWNAPKKSTYAKIDGHMYLDEKEYVQWACITEYSDAKDVLAYIQDFGMNKALEHWVRMKIAYVSAMIDGTAYFRMNGVKRETTPAEIEDYKAELEVWKKALELKAS